MDPKFQIEKYEWKNKMSKQTICWSDETNQDKPQLPHCHHKMRTIGRTSSCGQELMMATTNAFIWDKTCNNSLSFETTLFFLLTSNRQKALWVLFYEIHIMLLVILDVISKSFRESTEFTALDGWEVQRDPWFLLVFGVLDSKLLLEEATAKIINQWTPIMTFCDVTMWINEAMKTKRTNTLGEIKSAKETEFWTHWSRLFLALNET